MRYSEPGYRSWRADECLAGRSTERLQRAPSSGLSKLD